ncbi:MAG: hypothetical protein PHS78_05855 [Aliarcobacter skirrowii]|uniref:hypothetical protein n=2 Tax=Aliarcobacter skirrowii TaxID=28200 RepID=UPI00242B9C84|nr:hypothetical protein [Aliarcobacter skirrowii]MDD2508544.1 hypothetical protein [Aliarcobacter skirrowii]MDD3026430.1 hypothetical protein [Aliarcobacter skirrowii]MDD3497251.1 hypothetical protein [Aliarcobacter skirrowii]
MFKKSYKKLFFLAKLTISSGLFASDVISIDSILKKEKQDFRLSTNIDIISSNGTRTFSSYPILVSYDDGTLVTETQQVVFGQTLMYGLSNNLDLFLSYNILNDRVSYIDFDSQSTKSDNSINPNSLYIGGNYTFDSLLIDEFQQSITFQTAVLQNIKYQNEDKNYSFKDYNLKYSIKSFSDPLITILSIGTNQILRRDINSTNIDLPNSYFIGLDLFLILNPNISLNLNTEHSYQTSMKEDGVKVNNSTILSTIGFGLTYNLSEKNAITIDSSVGTSTNAPDSRLTFSLWHKF